MNPLEHAEAVAQPSSVAGLVELVRRAGVVGAGGLTTVDPVLVIGGLMMGQTTAGLTDGYLVDPTTAVITLIT